jgi:hypothetical protein
MKLFRELSEEETQAFQAWARANYVPYAPTEGVWHPVIQEECARMKIERLKL